MKGLKKKKNLNARSSPSGNVPVLNVSQPATSMFRRPPPAAWGTHVLLNLLDWSHTTLVGEEVTQMFFSWVQFHSHSFTRTLHTNCYFTKTECARSTIFVTIYGRRRFYDGKLKIYQMRYYIFILFNFILL